MFNGNSAAGELLESNTSARHVKLLHSGGEKILLHKPHPRDIMSVAEEIAKLNNTLEYKGYQTHIYIDFESHLLHGRIEGIRDLVNFESETITGFI